MGDRKTVLILGGGTMQLPAIRIARRKGWRVAVADGNPAVDGKALADVFIHRDLKDVAGLERDARDLQERGGLDGVFTAGTDFSASVAWVAEKLGLPGIDHVTAQGATDKSRMREIFAERGVPHPRFTRVGPGEDPVRVAAPLGFPLVVKPVDNMGSRGVRRVDTPEALAAAYASALGLSRSSTVIVEEYMEGPELSIDAIVYRGEVTICGVADRHIWFPPHFVELGHTMPTTLDSALVGAAVEAFRAGVAALGIHTGAAKGDVKVTPRGPRIGEIAARLSGGYMSGWTYPYASGVEATEGGLNVAVGLPPGDLAPTRRHWSAERAFISIPGVVDGVHGLAEARSGDAVRNVFVRTLTGLREVEPQNVPDPSGIEVVFPTNNVEKCGNVLTQGATREIAVEGAEEAVRRIIVRLRPDEPRTTAYLLGAPCAHPAHPLGSARTREALAAMPLSAGDGALTGILPLALGDDAGVRDWCGRRLDEALGVVERLSGLRVTPGDGGLRVGRAFWRALVAGGVQGGLYLVDTLRARQRAGGDVRGLLGG